MVDLVHDLKAALVRAGETHDLIRDVGPMFAAGRAQYWREGDGAIVTEIQKYPNFSAVNYWLVAGELRDALALQPRIDAWAVEQGCTRAVAIGRRGWSKVLPAHGWKPFGVAFAKDLKNG